MHTVFNQNDSTYIGVRVGGYLLLYYNIIYQEFVVYRRREGRGGGMTSASGRFSLFGRRWTLRISVTN